ncbi:MAG: hypothetical protein IJM36_01425 [Acholeplasmatales bacterium]|nr:hypothetical protein [Acholeplasmatales bacterium]
MLKKIFESGYFNYQDFILENIKKLSISPIEAFILIKMLDAFKNDKRILIDNIAKDFVEKRKNIEDSMSNLIEKGFCSIYISYDNGLGEESISLDGFFEIAERIINNVNASDKNDELASVIEYLNNELNRVLSSQELEIITSLVKEDYYALDDFKKAIEVKLKDKSVISIKSIAKALATKEKKTKVQSNNDLMKDFIKNVK